MGATCCNTGACLTGEISDIRRTVATRAAGRYLKEGDLPVGFYRAVRNALLEAEGRADGPVHHVDIYRALIDLGETETTPTSITNMCHALFDMVRNDEILTDDEMNRYTVRPANQRTAKNETEFELCSDRLARKYPGY